MRRPAFLRFAVPLLLMAHCSGKIDTASSPSSHDAGTPGSGDDAQGTPHPGDDATGTMGDDATGAMGDDASPRGTVCSGRVPAKHRDHASTCSASPLTFDAGVVTCSSDADCADAGGPVGYLLRAYYCQHGQCSVDQCFSDGDCSNNEVCSCSSDNGAYAGSSVNTCVPGNCRTDADCAPGAFCSPSDRSGGQGHGIQGYYCHTCADLCTDDNECTSASTCGAALRWCAYDPAVAHWACGFACIG